MWASGETGVWPQAEEGSGEEGWQEEETSGLVHALQVFEVEGQPC